MFFVNLGLLKRLHFPIVTRNILYSSSNSYTFACGYSDRDFYTYCYFNESNIDSTIQLKRLNLPLLPVQAEL